MTVGGVRIADVRRAAREHTVVLAPETVGYLVLELADAYCASGRLPNEEAAVLLVDGGAILLTSPTECPPSEAEGVLRDLLQRLLAVASGRAPALEAVAVRPCAAGAHILVAELASALVPLNRDASKRALSRLARDVLRARSGTPAEAVSSAAHSGFGRPVAARSLASRPQTGTDSPTTPAPARMPVAVYGGTKAPPRKDVPVAVGARSADLLVQQFISSPPPDAPAADASPLDSSAACDAGAPPAACEVKAPAACEVKAPAACEVKAKVMCDAAGGAEREDAGTRDEDAANRCPAEGHSTLEEAASEPAKVPAAAPRRRQHVSPASAPREPDWSRAEDGTRRSGRGWIAAALGLVGLAGAAVAFVEYGPPELRAWLFGGSGGERLLSGARTSDCRASIVVDQGQAGSEVLLRLGVAPLDIARLPEGTRPEFVATANGFEPRRVVVPSNAPWQKVDDRWKFELAVQLEASSKPGSGAFVRPATLAGTEPLRGTVHVVATPPGAEIWAPAKPSSPARFDGLPCGVGADLLFVRENAGSAVQERLRVSANQLTPELGQRAVVAHVNGRF